MSTILDALRKAQEDTGDKRQPPVGEHPAANEAVAPAPRARRRIRWPIAVLGILAVAFAGGLALGDRIVALFGGSGDAPSPDAQVASRGGEAAVPATGADVKQQAPAAKPTPMVRRGRRAAGAADGAPPPRFAQTADPVTEPQGAGAQAGAQAGTPDAAPTPYGRLHVFGAGERPAQGKPQNDDRLARLQQLREKMLKARQDAGARGEQDTAAASTQIFVPPPREPASGQAGGSKVTAPAGESEPAAAAARNAAPGETHEAPPEVAHADAAAAAAPPAEPAAAAVGVSVTNAHAEAADAEMRDPDIPGQASAEPARAAAAEPPVTVASIPPPEPAAQAAPAPAAPASAPGALPVLRRAPGGAPQVAINILQWSAEPGRRFAFVSVDGGNMTQVREGDHIGGLTIKHIHQQMIEFGFNESTFLLRAN